MNLSVGNKLAQNASTQWGANGRTWIAQLPSVVERSMRRWSLESIGTPFPAAQYSFVAPAWLADGRKAVLKVGFVYSVSDDIACEIAALTCYGGNDAVALIEHHSPDDALLLERARSGA
ncbi:MAG: hypothetical protein VXW00_01185 [Candidatus Latescibacterota bacterium]|nr:hypothetical protein [Candidatus Latescibacterota bacterium]MEE2725912.1 hypothetical protein [Candidatus Latescibacterota bacterium]